MEEMANFCEKCGSRTENGVCPKCTPQATRSQPNIYNQSDNEGRFVSDDEQLVYQLGSGYVGTFLAGGGLTKNAAAVTNKRVYYKGNGYTTFGIGLRRCKATQIVDLKDITCVGVYKAFNIGMIIAGLICFAIGMYLTFWAYFPRFSSEILGLIVILASFLLIIGSLVSQRTVLRIDYSGGCVAMNIKSFSKKECEDFRAAVYRAKDSITNY